MLNFIISNRFGRLYFTYSNKTYKVSFRFIIGSNKIAVIKDSLTKSSVGFIAIKNSKLISFGQASKYVLSFEGKENYLTKEKNKWVLMDTNIMLSPSKMPKYQDWDIIINDKTCGGATTIYPKLFKKFIQIRLNDTIDEQTLIKIVMIILGIKAHSFYEDF